MNNSLTTSPFPFPYVEYLCSACDQTMIILVACRRPTSNNYFCAYSGYDSGNFSFIFIA